MKIGKRVKYAAAGTAALALLWSTSGFAADAAKSSGTPEDNAYAAKVWAVMASNRLIGDGRVRSFPFVGLRPHGSIQEIVATTATVDGHTGRLIVKHNYGAKEALTPASVYEAGESKNYEAVTIMFQREKGYDAANSDWFWAEYRPDGSVINYQGTDLSGRSTLCISCHAALGGADREILNGRAR